MIRFRNQRGDTIVEVLISLAVLSLVVGGAYSIANGALRASRQAQERSAATKLAESQLETLKTKPTGVPADNVPFCINSSGTVTAWAVLPPGYLTDPYSDYPAQCRNHNNLYNVFITHIGEVYTVNVRWDRIGGGKEQLQFVYREYENES